MKLKADRKKRHELKEEIKRRECKDKIRDVLRPSRTVSVSEGFSYTLSRSMGEGQIL